jgi:hypothetical protein
LWMVGTSPAMTKGGGNNSGTNRPAKGHGNEEQTRLGRSLRQGGKR